MISKIYEGSVTHHRFGEVEHSFQYKLFMMYLDLDEIVNIFKMSPWWSIEKKNLVTFRRADYHRPEIKDLKDAIYQTVFEKTGHKLEGPVRVLTHLRYFGYCMNPVSFYYCFDKEGNNLEIVLAEIENTPWGERYQYVFKTSNSNIFEFEKDFHVSPFFPMDLNYKWTFSIPLDNLFIKMNSFKEDHQVFNAYLKLQSREIKPFNLNKFIIKYPFMTLKVIIGIYLQAAFLWLKKVPFFSHPDTKSQKSFLIFKGDKK